MGRVDAGVYRPDPDRARAYDALYAEYRELHDHFGRGGNDVMLRLRAIRNAARRTTDCRRTPCDTGRVADAAWPTRHVAACTRADPVRPGGLDGRQVSAGPRRT